MIESHQNTIDQIIDEAYKLYMPQIRSEIEQLYKFVQKKYYDVYPFNILEIGTKYGGTFYIWNQLNKSGLNISIDMDDGGLHGGIGNEEMNKRDLWFQERFQNCHFIRGDSHDNKTRHKVFEFLYLNTPFDQNDPEIQYGRFDFLFIDGDHTYEGVKRDFEMYSPFVKSKSVIAFHDIIISEYHHSRNVYVGEFWNEIKKNDNFIAIEIIDHPNQNWGGIGILIKK